MGFSVHVVVWAVQQWLSNISEMKQKVSRWGG